MKVSITLSVTHLIQLAPFWTDLRRLPGLCQADLDPPLVCQAFAQTGPVIQRAASLLHLLVLKGQAAGLLSLFQVCESHTLQDIHHAASHLSNVTHTH